MASKTRTLPISASIPSPLPPVHSKPGPVSERISAQVLDRAVAPALTTDLFLYHNEADATWCRQFAERIQSERSGNRNFAIQLVSWDYSSATDISAETETCLRTGRFFGLVVSRSMLQEDWPALEKLISFLSDLGLAMSRFVPILKENVTMPSFLRLKEWIDFRDGRRFEEGIRDLLTLLREDFPSPQESPQLAMRTGSGELERHVWKKRLLFVRAEKVRERIISNLFPVVEIPKYIFSAESKFQTESEVVEHCGTPGPLPFLLKGSSIYSVAALTGDSDFAPALKEEGKSRQEPCIEWLSDSERSRWGIELLNRSLRYHAWKRGIRFDEGQNLFYFTRSKPKNLWWEIGGKIIQREVTAPLTKWNAIDGNRKAEVQCGWRHEAIRARFVRVFGELFLRLEPAWFMTELDGKTPFASQPVGPLEGSPQNQESSAQVLRTLRFWSAIFAKGHRELRIETGTNPIRVRLTPASGSSPSVLSNDQTDFDSLALADVDDAQFIPELGPIEQ